MLTMLLLLSIAVVAATQYQRDLFHGTTSRLEERMSAVVELESVLRDVDGPAAGMMYALGDEQDYAGYVEAYQQERTRIEGAFDQVSQVVSPGSESDVLGQARSSWQQMDAGVLDAPGMHERGEVFPALQAGQDPFAETWEQLTAVHASLGELTSLLVVDLRHSMAAAANAQRLVLSGVIGAVVLAAVFTVLAARALQRRVLTPIQTLSATALAMRDSAHPRLDELTPHQSVAELVDLAATLHETALSLRTSHDQLRSQANTDELTGLANRKAFTETLQASIGRPRSGQLAALFIDLDDFKIVNDTMGHAAGDELLRVVAQRLSACVRNGELVARLGGDEFAILIDDVDEPAAIAVADRALAALQAPVTIQDRTVAVACSIGVALSTSNVDSASADELVHNADQAMYAAKQYGKNRVEVFNHSLYTDAQARIELRREISQAVAQNEFELHYQPVIDLHSGQLLGFEALIRWQHPSRGLLAPGEFIALAEETGDIVNIGGWVIDQACRDLATHLAVEPDAPSLWVSVNVSAKQLECEDFAEVVLEAVKRHDIAPRSLVIEITEAVAVTNTSQAVSLLDELREHGVVIALDDFGMGFSSLRYIAELPIDLIKIDRSFVSAPDPRTAAALNAIIALGHRLDLSLIAEGIETVAELENVRAMGQLGGQGFLFARPMPVLSAATYITGSDNHLPMETVLPALDGRAH